MTRVSFARLVTGHELAFADAVLLRVGRVLRSPSITSRHVASLAPPLRQGYLQLVLELKIGAAVLFTRRLSAEAATV